MYEATNLVNMKIGISQETAPLRMPTFTGRSLLLSYGIYQKIGTRAGAELSTGALQDHGQWTSLPGLQHASSLSTHAYLGACQHACG